MTGDDADRQILRAMVATSLTTADHDLPALCGKTGLSLPALERRLADLERDGLVERLPNADPPQYVLTYEGEAQAKADPR